MTEEEAFALDERLTNNPPKVDPSKKGGIFTRQRNLIEALDRVSADYITSRALATNKMPLQVISDLVREKIAVAM